MLYMLHHCFPVRKYYQNYKWMTLRHFVKVEIYLGFIGADLTGVRQLLHKVESSMLQYWTFHFVYAAIVTYLIQLSEHCHTHKSRCYPTLMKHCEWKYIHSIGRISKYHMHRPMRSIEESSDILVNCFVYINNPYYINGNLPWYKFINLV